MARPVEFDDPPTVWDMAFLGFSDHQIAEVLGCHHRQSPAGRTFSGSWARPGLSGPRRSSSCGGAAPRDRCATPAGPSSSSRWCGPPRPGRSKGSSSNSERTAVLTVSKMPRGRPFQPGQSGNPRGRPSAEVCLTALLRAALAEKDVEGKRTKARAVIDALVEQALDGKTAAIQQIFDRIDGLLQPILQNPELDLEAVAKAMQEKRDRITRDSGGPDGGVPG